MNFLKILQLINDNKPTKKINAFEMALTAEQLTMLVAALNQRTVPVTMLDISMNDLDDSAVQILLTIKSHIVRHLDVSSNNMTLSIALQLIKANIFEHINLSRNNIKLSLTAAQQLFEAKQISQTRFKIVPGNPCDCTELEFEEVLEGNCSSLMPVFSR